MEGRTLERRLISLDRLAGPAVPLEDRAEEDGSIRCAAGELHDLLGRADGFSGLLERRVGLGLARHCLDRLGAELRCRLELLECFAAFAPVEIEAPELERPPCV